MQTNRFAAYHKARKLNLENKMLSVYADSNILVYPYQVAAASFAINSYSNGVVLADEGSLGKTYEALLIIAQKWYDGVRNILIVVPSHLIAQWEQVLTQNFNIPFSKDEILEEGIYLTTYDNGITSNDWEIVCFDEAQRLRKDNDTNNRIKQAVSESYKILLTPAPIMNDIMDLYHLISFIDPEEFPDADEYYNRYFRHEEHYQELAQRASKYVFRTLKEQVAGYVNIPKRLVASIEFNGNEKEQELHEKVLNYCNHPFKKAYPKMANYDLMLMLTGILASSTFAFTETMRNLLGRLDDVDEWERAELTEIAVLTEQITENTKIEILKKLMPLLFKELKAKGANKKAIVFVKNKITAKILKEQLKNVIIFKDSSSVEKFKTDADILIATDIANEGLNLEFCSCVINFDMSYNTLDIEQRILRCHRQNQENDVLVVNLINTGNANNVRCLELYKKRIKQFAGIFGISDDILGESLTLEAVIDFFNKNARNKADIEKQNVENLDANETINLDTKQKAKSILFSTFDAGLVPNTELLPEYIETKRKEISDDLWYLASHIFANQNGLILNDETRTIKTMRGYGESKLFGKLRIRKDVYSMQDKSFALGVPLARNIISEIINERTYPNGKITGFGTPLTLEFYEIEVKKGKGFWGKSYTFTQMVGKTADGKILSNDECEYILNQPFQSVQESGNRRTWEERMKNPNKQNGSLVDLLDLKQYRDMILKTTEILDKQIISKLKRTEHNRKHAIEKELSELERKGKELDKLKDEITNNADRIKWQKAKVENNALHTEKENNLFMEKMQIEYETEQKIKELMNDNEINIETDLIFKLEVQRDVASIPPNGGQSNQEVM